MVAEIRLHDVAATSPTWTALTPVNDDPRRVTTLPLLNGPEAGDTERTTGGFR
jgi:hypothetical protein